MINKVFASCNNQAKQKIHAGICIKFLILNTNLRRRQQKGTKQSQTSCYVRLCVKYKNTASAEDGRLKQVKMRTARRALKTSLLYKGSINGW
jgi:hypothetical protein